MPLFSQESALSQPQSAGMFPNVTLSYSNEERLAEQRKKIAEIAKVLATIDPGVAGAIEKTLQETVAFYKKELVKLELDTLLAAKEIEALNKKIENAKEAPVPEMLVDAALKDTPTYHELFDKQRAAQKSLDAAKKDLSASVPKLKEMEEQAQMAADDIKKFLAEARPAIIEKIRNQAILQDKQKVKSLQQAIDLNAIRHQAVDEELQKFIRDDVKPFKGNEIALEQLKSDLAQTEKITDRILSDIDSIRPDLDSPMRVAIWQEPIAVTSPEETRPTLPEEPRPMLEGTWPLHYRLIAGFAAIIIGVVLIIAFDHRYRRATCAQDVVG
jgi:hypothetical protein